MVLFGEKIHTPELHFYPAIILKHVSSRQMNIDINDILNHLFQKQTIHDVDTADIEQLADKFPYYAPAQYLLAKKNQQSQNEKYIDQTKKTALYFTNPHWLDSLLYPQTLPQSEIIYTEKKVDIIATPAVDTANDTIAEKIIDIPEEKIIEEENNIVEENAVQKTTVDIAEEKSIEKSKDDNNAFEETLLQEDVKLPVGDFSLAQVKAAFNQPLPADDNAGNDIIPIEPLHTIDYFASQGIKLSNEYEGKDRLSKKLKSFTEWLKTMKKIHPEKLEADIDNNTQQSIQDIAEHANEQKEIVTEAMAEVYARQGLNKKAEEIYQKLSLLNPDKRVYFAAKISKLNND
jgi:hypothetical protein